MRHRPRGKRKPWTAPAHALTIRIQGSGNATIVDRSGETVGVVEDWILFIGGVRITEVNNYRESVDLVTTTIYKEK